MIKELVLRDLFFFLLFAILFPLYYLCFLLYIMKIQIISDLQENLGIQNYVLIIRMWWYWLVMSIWEPEELNGLKKQSPINL